MIMYMVCVECVCRWGVCGVCCVSGVIICVWCVECVCGVVVHLCGACMCGVYICVVCVYLGYMCGMC